MQKEKQSDCPIDIWLSAKICFPDGQRGFAIAKLIEENNVTKLILTLDQNLLAEIGKERARNNDKKGILDSLSGLNLIFDTSNKNLSNLPKGTAILLAPPKLFGVKFWIARLGEPIEMSRAKNKIESSVTYDLIELKRLKNFLEARSCPRIVFRTSILLIDQKNYMATQCFTYDISAKGVGIILDSKSPCPFECNENYLLQLQIHEGIHIPPLNYKCVHIREDIITGTKIAGFQLNDEKANDPDVEYNLTLLSWSDGGVIETNSDSKMDDIVEFE